MDESIRHLTLSEAVDACIACRKNARELIEEADLLQENGKLARAFTLTHTACEELAKASMFAAAAKTIAKNTGMNWKRFWERIRNHNSKISHIEVLLLIATEAGLSLDRDIAQSLDVLLPYGLHPRNSSMYVEFIADGSVGAPSNLDWTIPLPAFRALADFLVQLTGQNGDTKDEIVKNLNSDRNAINGEKLGLVFKNIAAICWDVGVPKERMEKAINRAYQKN